MADLRLALDPRLRVLYLATVAFGVFAARGLPVALAVAATQAALWIAVGLPPRRLVRQVTKLWGFFLFLAVSYAITRDDPDTDRWQAFVVFGRTIALNIGGLQVASLMMARVLAVVLASQVARAGDERAVARGLDMLGVPRIVAASVDAVLALLGPAGRKRGHGGGGGRGGGGGGGGGGRGRSGGGGGGGGGGDGGGGGWREGGGGAGAHDRGAADGGDAASGARADGEGLLASFKRVMRGDVGPIARHLEEQIARARNHAAANTRQGEAESGLQGDVAVIAGVSLAMLGVKALKILPSIPFAPGHKLVILTPLYVIATRLTRTRFGGTLTGLTMGTVAFLLGDGRYGVFEIVKHVTPGIVCDLLVPLLGRGGRDPGRLAWFFLGAAMGAGRFATIFVVTLAVQAPAVAYAFLLPGLAVHTTFGALSGWVSHHLVRAVAGARYPDAPP